MTMRAHHVLVVLCCALAFALPACAPREDFGVDVSNVSAAVRRERATAIRDACRARGLTGGALLVAALAEEETQLSFCASEFRACAGPTSPACGGRAVLSGGGDGPCSANQGGLGMFQIDDGTEAETVAMHGERVLTLAGNTDVAIDRILDKFVRSRFVSGVATRAEAIAFLNHVRIDDADWDSYVRTVVRYWNGCPETNACWSNRYPKYDHAPRTLLNEFGYAFWYGDVPDGGMGDAGRDAGRDSGMRDSSVPRDSAVPRDTSIPRDTSVPRDTSIPRDTSVPRDAGQDAGRDSGRRDAGPRDAGGSCRSSILGRTVADGECVQLGPERHECTESGCGWYGCQAGAWVCMDEASCPGARYPNDACTGGAGASCYSPSLGGDISDGACIQVNYAACHQSSCGWYRCSNGGFACTDQGSCSGDRFPHPDCTDCGLPGTSCTRRVECCTQFDCAPRTFGDEIGECCLQGNLPCESDGDCCGTMLCVGHVCACHGPGESCASDVDCCGGSWCTNRVCGFE